MLQYLHVSHTTKNLNALIGDKPCCFLRIQRTIYTLRTFKQLRQQKRIGPHLTIHTMLNFNFSLALLKLSHVLHIITIGYYRSHTMSWFPCSTGLWGRSSDNGVSKRRFKVKQVFWYLQRHKLCWWPLQAGNLWLLDPYWHLTCMPYTIRKRT